MMKLHGLKLFLENSNIIDRNLELSTLGGGVGWAKVPNAPGPAHYQGFAMTFRRTRVNKTSLDK